MGHSTQGGSHSAWVITARLALKRDGRWFHQDLSPALGSGERILGAACRDGSEH